MVKLQNTPAGEYVVTQKQAPSGYALNSYSQHITLATGKSGVVEVLNDRIKDKPTLHIRNLDAETRCPLAGGKFKVTAAGKLIGEFTTDANGLITIADLEAGKYVVEQTQAADKYQLDTFSGIRNKSDCALDDFYWRNVLSVDAVRIQSLTTGTWNERGTYDVLIKTNQKNWITIKSGLSTAKEYTIDMSPSALGLATDDYVTEFK